jgi:polar amino acid transport system permease protein
MDWDWGFVREIMPTLLEGVKITILATLLGSLVAAIIGLVFALARRSSNKPLAYTTSFLVEFIRGTPLLVQLYFLLRPRSIAPASTTWRADNGRPPRPAT